VLGQEARQVSCQAWNPPWSKFAEPAAAAATIAFDGRVVVSYRGSWVSPAPRTLWAGEWRMECERGAIFWTSRDNQGTGGDRVTVRLLGKAARRVELPELPAVDQAGSLAAFAQAIRTGQEPETSGRANLGSLTLALATIESATLGLPVPVPQP
jgi:predicted dehydrogenase